MLADDEWTQGDDVGGASVDVLDSFIAQVWIAWLVLLDTTHVCN